MDPRTAGLRAGRRATTVLVLGGITGTLVVAGVAASSAAGDTANGTGRTSTAPDLGSADGGDRFGSQQSSPDASGGALVLPGTGSPQARTGGS